MNNNNKKEVKRQQQQQRPRNAKCNGKIHCTHVHKNIEGISKRNTKSNEMHSIDAKISVPSRKREKELEKSRWEKGRSRQGIRQGEDRARKAKEWGTSLEIWRKQRQIDKSIQKHWKTTTTTTATAATAIVEQTRNSHCFVSWCRVHRVEKRNFVPIRHDRYLPIPQKSKKRDRFVFFVCWNSWNRKHSIFLSVYVLLVA